MHQLHLVFPLLCFRLLFCQITSRTRRRILLLKALVYYCFLVLHHNVEYVSLDLFYRIVCLV